MRANHDDALEAAAATIAKACIGARVRMLNRLVSRIYEDSLRDHGVRFSQLNILTIIALKGCVQPIEISRTLALEKSTLSRNLRLMEGNGWITTSEADGGNAQTVKLTRKGKRLYQRAAPAWAEAQQKIEKLIGIETADAIRDAVHSAQN